MAKVELKQPVVQEIAELFNGAQTAVAVDYRGLTVAEDTQLRKKLREAGITYKVYKNTLIRLAAKDTPYEALGPILEGPTAIAVSKEDATAPARILADFAKTAKKLEMQQQCRPSLPFRPERSFSEDFSEACSRRSQTSHVCLSRLRRKTARELRQQRLLRKHNFTIIPRRK